MAPSSNSLESNASTVRLWQPNLRFRVPVVSEHVITRARACSTAACNQLNSNVCIHPLKGLGGTVYVGTGAAVFGYSPLWEAVGLVNDHKDFWIQVRVVPMFAVCGRRA